VALAASTAALTTNTAIGNGNFGIYSVGTSAPSGDSIYDGGGNVAKKNAVGQCVNILCQP
jgi:hypothetical protein